jgi:hypothetical protein
MKYFLASMLAFSPLAACSACDPFELTDYQSYEVDIMTRNIQDMVKDLEVTIDAQHREFLLDQIRCESNLIRLILGIESFEKDELTPKSWHGHYNPRSEGFGGSHRGCRGNSTHENNSWTIDRCSSGMPKWR